MLFFHLLSIEIADRSERTNGIMPPLLLEDNDQSLHGGHVTDQLQLDELLNAVASRLKSGI